MGKIGCADPVGPTSTAVKVTQIASWLSIIVLFGDISSYKTAKCLRLRIKNDFL